MYFNKIIVGEPYGGLMRFNKIVEESSCSTRDDGFVKGLRSPVLESVQEDLKRGGCGQTRAVKDGLKPVRTRRGRAEALEVAIGSTLPDYYVKAHHGPLHSAQ